MEVLIVNLIGGRRLGPKAVKTFLKVIPTVFKIGYMQLKLFRRCVQMELTLLKWGYSAGKSVFGVAPAIVQWAHYEAYV